MPAYPNRKYFSDKFQRKLLAPCISIRFKGVIVKNNESVSEKGIVKINNVSYIIDSDHRKAKNVIRDPVLEFRVLTKYINQLISEKYKYLGRKKGFLTNRSINKDKIEIKFHDANLYLDVYRTFRTSFYTVKKDSVRNIRVFLSIGAKFELTPNLGELLQSVKQRFKHETLESLLEDILGVELSTIREYWEQKIGSIGAGVLKKIIFFDEKDYKTHFEKILDYYKKKGERHYEFVTSILKENERPPIVITEKYHKGELTVNRYLGNLLLLTPNYEVLSDWLDENTLDKVKGLIRPKKKDELWRVYDRYLGEIKEIVNSQEFFEVGECP